MIHTECFVLCTSAILVYQYRRNRKMNHDSYASMALIPLLLTVVLMFYGIRLLVMGDVESIRGKKNKKKLRNEKMYAREGGKLLLFLAVSSLAMAIILYWDVTIAVVQLCVCMVIFGILWKMMDKKYGE